MNNDFIKFDELKAGQFLKITGKYFPGRGVLAVEVVSIPGKEKSKLAGSIEDTKEDISEIQILGAKVVLNGVHEIRNPEGQDISAAGLAVGQVVKMRGKFINTRGFSPNKIKIQEKMDFNIDEIEGRIQEIDRENRTFLVNNIKIITNPKTIYLKEN